MGGWDMMRQRLDGEDFGVPYGNRPMIYCFDTCIDSIRTIPMMQHDDKNPEDLDTKAEDHAVDDWRYACMSRPYLKPLPEKVAPIKGIQSATLNELWATNKPEKKRI